MGNCRCPGVCVSVRAFLGVHVRVPPYMCRYSNAKGLCGYSECGREGDFAEETLMTGTKH